MLRKALQIKDFNEKDFTNLDDMWKTLMLAPADFGKEAIFDKTARALMEKMTFEHGGQEYDDKYPEGIPTSVQITLKGKMVLLYHSSLIL